MNDVSTTAPVISNEFLGKMQEGLKSHENPDQESLDKMKKVSDNDGKLSLFKSESKSAAAMESVMNDLSQDITNEEPDDAKRLFLDAMKIKLDNASK